MVIDAPQRSSIPICRSDGIDRVAPAHMQGTHRLVRLYHNDHLYRHNKAGRVALARFEMR